MDRRDVETFTTIMRLGSVTAAASALGVAQPSVSKALALIEHRLGFKLFDRSKGRLVPTPEATLVFDEAIRIEDELSRFDRYLDNVRDLRAGQLRIAATPALALGLLPPAARLFRRARADYGLVLDMHLNHEIPDLVARGQYDLGLAVVPSTDETPILQPIRQGRMVCVMSDTHALTRQSRVAWNEMDSSDFIYITTDARLVALLTTGVPDFARRLGSALETNRYTVAINLVRHGAGVTLVDEFTMVDADMSGLAVRPFEPELHVSLVAAVGTHRARKKALPQFMAALQEVLFRPIAGL